MNRFRVLLAGITALLLAAGYLASQQALIAGTFAEYSAKVDQPPIIMLSLILFLSAVAFCFIKDKEEPQD